MYTTELRNELELCKALQLIAQALLPSTVENKEWKKINVRYQCGNKHPFHGEGQRQPAKGNLEIAYYLSPTSAMQNTYMLWVDMRTELEEGSRN